MGRFRYSWFIIIARYYLVFTIPPNDPVFEAKRKHVNDPFWDVDVPYMILRLRQGIGRLIRTSEDKGAISIFLSDSEDEKVVAAVKNVLPVEGKEL